LTVKDKKINGFEDLEAWQLAHKLMLEVYRLVEDMPKEEKYNRIEQIKRSVSAITANIAEGFGRHYHQENLQFCRMARGSLEETRNHLIAARDLKQIADNKYEEINELALEARRVLNGYIRYLNSISKKLTTHNSQPTTKKVL
jgi:four helix bundle protein